MLVRAKLLREARIKITKVGECSPQFTAAALGSQKIEIAVAALWCNEGAHKCDLVFQLSHAIMSVAI